MVFLQDYVRKNQILVKKYSKRTSFSQEYSHLHWIKLKQTSNSKSKEYTHNNPYNFPIKFNLTLLQQNKRRAGNTFIEPRNTAIPSGKLCKLMPAARRAKSFHQIGPTKALCLHCKYAITHDKWSLKFLSDLEIWISLSIWIQEKGPYVNVPI